MKHYSLTTLLDTFSTKTGKKRTVFNGTPVGGTSSGIVKALLFSLPLVEYAAIFNPFVFGKLGIVTAIVLYIVGMSLIMMAVFLIILKTRNKVLLKINDSWNEYFPSVELKMVLATGITPYSDFFKYYSEYARMGLSEEELYTKLQNAFAMMQEENKELLIAIKKDNKNI